MNEQALMKRRIEALKFAIWELHLFLDSHPYNTDATKKKEEYEKNLKVLIREYENKYGRIFPTSKNTSRYEWISSPWPWETEDASHVDL